MIVLLTNEKPEGFFSNREKPTKVINVKFEKGDRDDITLSYRLEQNGKKPGNWEKFPIGFNSVFSANHNIIVVDEYIPDSHTALKTWFRAECKKTDTEFKVSIDFEL